MLTNKIFNASALLLMYSAILVLFDITVSWFDMTVSCLEIIISCHDTTLFYCRFYFLMAKIRFFFEDKDALTVLCGKKTLMLFTYIIQYD